MADTEYFYPGGNNSLEPNSNLPFTTFSSLGTSMDARTANQVKEASKHLNTGLKVFEVAGHSAEVFDSMPDEQLDEIRRMNKLVGAEATVHAPMIDPAGFVKDRWDRSAQQDAERQLWNAVERSHKIKPDGNILVNFHASTGVGLPAEEIVKVGKEFQIQSMLLVDPKGGVRQIKDTQSEFFPTENMKPEDIGKPVKFNPTYEIEKQNREMWQNQLTNLALETHRAQQIIEQRQEIPQKLLNLTPEEQKSHKELVDVKKQLELGSSFLKGAYLNLQNMYDLAYKGLDPKNEKDRKQLNDLNGFAKEILPYVGSFNDPNMQSQNLTKFAEMIDKGHSILTNMQPKILKPLKEFATDKSAETISNIAVKAFTKFHDTAPIIAIENHPAYQSILTTGDDLANVVKAARKKFVDQMTKEGLGQGEAETQAKKLIGATWDVGHINMLRKHGYEDKDIIEETKKVAPYVKHVHLSDNFGFEHTELPMGMGNVPIKEIMDQLGKQGFKGKKIIEALSWWQHFSDQGKVPALTPTLQGFNSPIYGMQNSPYWSQATGTDLIGGYTSFPLAYLPEKHFSMYGTGFSTLPQELGGAVPATNSRFTGTPNA